MRGMQCPKMIWLDRHRPSLKVIPPEVQERLDAGNEFGDKAMAMFGPYEEMTIYLPGTTIPDKKAMVAKTREHLDKGTAVICEAAFMSYNNYCAIDILRKTDNGYDIYEVKNTPEVHEQYIEDAAFQYYITDHCHLKVGKIFIVIRGEDENEPFVPVDVTEEVKKSTTGSTTTSGDSTGSRNSQRKLRSNQVNSVIDHMNAGTTDTAIIQKQKRRMISLNS